ncbi:MAG: ATP synthase F0 subunit B [Oribacterium sp.]|nr:ATP synthase F0 subunit B [Oribacterium sp.]
MLRVDINLLFTIVNLLFLVFLMKKFLFKPVRRVLNERKAEIDATYQKAEETKLDAEKLKQQYESSMASIDAERQKTLNQARIDASHEYDEIIENANRKADKIIKDAGIQAEKEAAEKREKVQKEVAELVAEAAYRMASAQDSHENDQKLYDRFLQNEETKKG